MSTVVQDLIGLGAIAVLLTCAIALDHLLRRLLTRASMPKPWRGFVNATAPMLTRPPIES